MIYSDYNRDRIGWFFGLSGWQLHCSPASPAGVLCPCSAAPGRPRFCSRRCGCWSWWSPSSRSAAGRPPAGSSPRPLFASAGLLGWTRVAQPKPPPGRVEDLTGADLPGVLRVWRSTTGRRTGPRLLRVAIIQDHAARPGRSPRRSPTPASACATPTSATGRAAAWPSCSTSPSRTELIDEVLFLVRTVPEDGAERDLWIARHRRRSGPALAAAGQRRPAAAAHRGVGAHRGVRHHRRPRSPDRPRTPRSPAAASTAAPGCCTG